MKRALRTKSVGTKVSEAELRVLESRAAAAGLTLSEWVRDVLLGSSVEMGAMAAEQAILAEVLAMRSILPFAAWPIPFAWRRSRWSVTTMTWDCVSYSATRGRQYSAPVAHLMDLWLPHPRDVSPRRLFVADRNNRSVPHPCALPRSQRQVFVAGLVGRKGGKPLPRACHRLYFCDPIFPCSLMSWR